MQAESDEASEESPPEDNLDATKLCTTLEVRVRGTDLSFLKDVARHRVDSWSVELDCFVPDGSLKPT